MAAAGRLSRQGGFMTHGHRFTLVAGTAIATASLLCGAAGAAVTGSRAGSAAGSGSITPAEVRVDQVG